LERNLLHEQESQLCDYCNYSGHLSIYKCVFVWSVCMFFVQSLVSFGMCCATKSTLFNSLYVFSIQCFNYFLDLHVASTCRIEGVFCGFSKLWTSGQKTQRESLFRRLVNRDPSLQFVRYKQLEVAKTN